MNHLTIAIDGPASAGKSSIAKKVAEKLNITYIDTGAMYRAVAWWILQQGMELEPVDQLMEGLNELEFSFFWNEEGQNISLNGQNITALIRSEGVNDFVSEVSAVKEIREMLVTLQQKMARKSGVIMDGRDIGTVVLPEADYKFFFTASAQVRALRRFKENHLKGYSEETLEEIEESIRQRDHYDLNREHSPLRQAADAILIDTSDLTIEETVEIILGYIQ